MKTTSLFILDDDPAILTLMTSLFDELYNLTTFSDPRVALNEIADIRPDIVISDVDLGTDINGIEVLEQIKSEVPETQVIIMSAQTTTSLAIEAIQLGALDYLHKPFEMEDVLASVKKAERNARISREENVGKVLKTSIYSKRSERMIGRAPKMVEIYKTIAKVANADTTILITGESGTGKELVARMIAALGPGGIEKYMAVNCSAIPETLFESELFGHEKGAFTSADSQKKGKVETCEGGILFLDEIDTLPLSVQTKILRLIQEKEYQRVGGTETLKTNVRILAACKENIENQVETGFFKKDLFYRLSIIRIDVPPLRERRDDIVELFNFFLTESNRKHGKKIREVSVSLLPKLKTYDWPGNIRELQNSVERAVILVGEGMLTEEQFPFLKKKERITNEDLKGSSIAELLESVLKNGITDLGIQRNYGQMYDMYNSMFDKSLIEVVLGKSKGSQIEAARVLGISRNTLREKVRRLEIDVKKIKQQ